MQLWGRLGFGPTNELCLPRINGPMPHKPSSSNFLSGTPHFCHPHFFTTEFSYKCINFAHYTGQENCIFLSARSVLWPKICQKCVIGQGLVPDPAGGAHDDPIVGRASQTPLHLAPSAPRFSRLRRSLLSAFRCFDRRAFSARHLYPSPSLVLVPAALRLATDLDKPRWNWNFTTLQSPWRDLTRCIQAVHSVPSQTHSAQSEPRIDPTHAHYMCLSQTVSYRHVWAQGQLLDPNS